MGDGRRPDEPLYVEGSERADDLTVRCAALQAAAQAVACNGNQWMSVEELRGTIFSEAERFEEWLTR